MTGFRINTDRIKKRLAKVKQNVAAESFRPDVEKFAVATLNTAIRITPVRSVQLIESNQVKQFHDRARYIRKNPGSATRNVTQGQFVKERAQARFLYRKSWKQCADSAKLRVNSSPAVVASVTRRRPAVNPPRGYAQWRGGGRTLSLVIFNPFLNIPSQYKKFNASDILRRAEAPHKEQYKRNINNRVRREIYAASKI